MWRVDGYFRAIVNYWYNKGKIPNDYGIPAYDVIYFRLIVTHITNTSNIYTDSIRLVIDQWALTCGEAHTTNFSFVIVNYIWLFRVTHIPNFLRNISNSFPSSCVTAG